MPNVLSGLWDMAAQVVQVYADRWEWFLELLLAHISLAGLAILIAGFLGLFLGILISEFPRFAPLVMGVSNVFYTIPAISLLGMLIPVLGIGDKNAVTALTIYALMPMIRNTYTGLTTTDADIVEAAVGMGSTRAQVLLRVKLPLAMSVIVAGLKNMVVMTISVCGIASFVGAGGLGVAIYRGINMYNPALTFAGSLLIALLALTCDFLLGRLERHLKTKWRMN